MAIEESVGHDVMNLRISKNRENHDVTWRFVEPERVEESGESGRIMTSHDDLSNRENHDVTCRIGRSTTSHGDLLNPRELKNPKNLGESWSHMAICRIGRIMMSHVQSGES
ncbi:hypothetical protein AMTR_s00151p00089370 [Amborella trichopoda]|uniref:Uncharacterized protein n=1 Tax=Amborella trichopoda TaxID=13333 RepID=W1NJW0_AMBTC|nr:hypothetical protein AMTR_s00151p00089370 [Amborella trichopoda]